MKKTIVVFASTLLLLGAGCGGGATDVGVADTYQQEVETAFAAFITAGEAEDEVALQNYVDAPIDSVDAGTVSGYFTIITPTIDWSTSDWSDDGLSVTLNSVDDVEIGTWKRVASGNWKATTKFWAE